MENAKHTPGPWSFNPATLNVTHTAMERIGQPTFGIAVVYGAVGNVETNATGALVAAAPELLAACERALPLLEKTAHPYNHEHSAAEVIRAAITKARGAA